MASEKLLELLNQAIARELQVSIQYIWHHVMATGMRSPEIKDRLKTIAIQEMAHAEQIAERLDYLGEVPTTKPAPIKVGGSLREMLQDDMKAEEAIALYRQIIKQAMEEEDYTTKRLFEQILADEEEHHDEFQTLLEAD